MAGYTRPATNIANGNVIDADDFDAEYNALEASFNTSTGHTHDGSGGEGAPIIKVGPSQDLVVSTTSVLPKTTSVLDLGSASLQFKDAFFDGTVDTDVLTVSGNATIGGNITIAGDATINGNLTFGDTSSDTVTFGADITSSLIPDGPSRNLGSSDKQWGNLWIDGTASMDALVADTADINAGTIDAVEIGGTTPGNITGTTITADSFVGPVNGSVSGNTSGTHTGPVLGNVTGNVTGNVGGNLTGGVTGDVTGNLTGDVTGNVTGALTGNADTATTLATARNFSLIGDVTTTAVSFDGSDNVTISVSVDDDSHNHTTANIDNLQEYVQDTIGAMVGSNTETGLQVSYDDTDGTLDFALTADPVITLTGAVTGTGTMSNLGNVSIATTPTSDPTITLAGDLSGNATLTNLGNATLTATIKANSVALGTDTSGNYVSTVTGGTGVSVSGGTGQTSTPTINIGQAVGIANNVTFNDLHLDGDASIDGNLNVTGTLTTTNTESLEVTSQFIIVNNGQTGTPTLDGGIEVERGTSTNRKFFWDESASKWSTNNQGLMLSTITGTGNFSTSGRVTASTGFTGNVTGTVSSISNFTTNNLAEGSSKLYYTTSRARGAVSAADNGGYGSFGYSSSTGVFSYTGPSSSNIRGVLSAGEGLDYNSSTGVFAAELASTSNKGVASFNTADFSVASGSVSLKDESIQDIVGAMVSGNTETNISVSYSDTSGKLNFSVPSYSPTLTLSGDASGNATFTSLGNATLSVVVANDSHTHDSRYYTESESDSRFTASAGDVMTGTLRFNDNVMATFGSGNDAEFWCSGSHMYLDLNSSIGNFYIRDGSTIRYTFNDNGSFTASGNITAYSDERLKSDIVTIPNALETVCKLRGVNFTKDGEASTGVIAQEVQKVIPEVVLQGDEYLSVAYGNLVGVLIEAVKELKAEVETLKKGQ